MITCLIPRREPLVSPVVVLRMLVKLITRATWRSTKDRSVCRASTIVVVVTTLLLAHSWYEDDCCHDKDCRPVEAAEVKCDNKGCWFRGIFTKHQHIRLSQDTGYHACFKENEWGLMLICLYVPYTGA